MEIIKNELGLFELHIDGELCVVKATKKEILDFIKETNSNFGFNFPLWDRLFGTYRAQPAAGHVDMVVGLSQFRDEKKLTLPRLLALPFIGKPGAYPIIRKRR